MIKETEANHAKGTNVLATVIVLKRHCRATKNSLARHWAACWISKAKVLARLSWHYAGLLGCTLPTGNARLQPRGCESVPLTLECVRKCPLTWRGGVLCSRKMGSCTCY